MKNRNLTSKMIALAVVGAGLLATSCKKDSNDHPQPPTNNVEEVLHVVYGVGSGGVGSTSSAVMLPFTDLSKGTIEFSKGFKISESRTDRVYTSTDGKDLYSLQYQVGTIKKFSYIGQKHPYYQEHTNQMKDLKGILGSEGARWRKISDQLALAYRVEVIHNKNNDNSYKNTTVNLHIASITLPDYVIKKAPVITLTADNDTSLSNLHVWRVDSPVVLGNKVYIGVAKRGYDGAENINQQTYKTSTLVLDYPSLENPKFIYSGIANGEAYGYRTPCYFTYDGSVYHNSTNETKILKITDGKYDDTYNFDLAKALRMDKVGASGMFYAGDGIAYINFYDATKGTSWGKNNKYWGVARVDLKAKTAIKMDLGLEDLWLAPNQSAKLGKDGKFYMALAPLNKDGNIYIFDPKSTSPTAFTKGATLKIAGDAFYLGVF